ncbi:MAG: MASE1 domain-containing protein [Betaproteobacteria bacterium]
MPDTFDSFSSTPSLHAPLSRPLWVDAFWVIVFGAVYVALFVFAISLPFRAGEAACIWPADGLAVGVLMRVGYRQWPAYCIMILLANALGAHLSGFGFSISGFTGMNVMQPAMAAWLLRCYFNLPRQVDTVHGILMFTLVTLAVNVLSSVMGAMDEVLSAGQTFWNQFKALFISDSLGILIVAPLIVTWSREGRRHLRAVVASREIEAALVFAGLVVSTKFVFGISPDSAGWVPQWQHLTIPFLVWAALRFGLRGSTLGITIYALMTLWYTANGTGPFSTTREDAGATVLSLQVFLGVIAVMILIGAALMTERRNSFADSESWRRRFQSAIDASGNLVFEIHADTGQIDWAGDTMKVLALSAEDLQTTRQWTSRVHPDDRERLLGLRRRLASGDLPSLALEYRVQRGDGNYILIGVHAYSVNAPASDLSLGRARGRRIIGFVKDITESRRAEEERKRLEAELRQAQKMEAIGQLAGGIAHDFNNILTSILGYGELARTRVEAGLAKNAVPNPEKDAALLRHLDTILKAGERGRNLVSQILTFSRKNPEHAQVLALADVLEEVVMLIRGSTPHEIQLKIAETSGHVNVRGNATELHQLFMNLCVNGLQAMPGTGVLDIDVDSVQLDTPLTVMQDQLPAGNYVKIAVTDHGEGIDEATQQRMFEPFFTTKVAGRGTGLGLSLAMSVAKSHGGGIDVRSTVGSGTVFTVYLPLAEGTAEAPAAPLEGIPRGQDERILLVDDEPALRSLAEEILVELGYQVASYENSEDALAAFERAPDRFDAVVSDEVMPGLTGTQLAARIHVLKPGLPIIIITGYGGAGFELRAQQSGVSAVMKKPYQKNALAHALAGALGRRTGNLQTVNRTKQ